MAAKRAGSRPAFKHGALLAGFALLVTGTLTLTQHLTLNQIENNESVQRQRTLSQVLPDKWYDHPLQQFSKPILDERTGTVRTCYIAKIDDKPVAVIISATAPDGYSGDIELLIGVTRAGDITGVRVSSHRETPGLGDAIELTRSEWIKSFDGKSLSQPTDSGWALKKNNGEFDQFTGATITPRAVINEVKNTLKFFQSVKSQLFAYE